MARYRTKFTLVLILVNFIVKNNCDNVRQTYPIDRNADLLLRGSDEEDTIKNIEPEKTLSVFKEEETTKDNIDYKTTTELPNTTTDVSKGDEVDDYFDMDRKMEDSTTVAEYMVTEAMSLMDNHVYRTEDSSENDSNIMFLGAKTDPTSPTTIRALDDEVLSSMPGFEETAISQRIPKTENSEPSPAAHKRTYEPQPLPPLVTKSATLKSWLEDTWLRPPAGILVPLRPMALNRALAVWNDMVVGGLNVSDIIIVGYDSNGVNWRSRHNLLQPSSISGGGKTVSEALSKLLLKYQGVNSETRSDGTLRALASAAKLVPYDSALFVVTDKGPGDAHRLPLALRALVEKRLKVYTIWTDPSHPSNESEAQLLELRNISKYTEGDVLPYSLQVMDVDGSNVESQQWESTEAQLQARKGKASAQIEEDKFDTLLVRRGGGEAISLGVAVENGVSALRIFIEGLVEHAVLYPPNDAPQIDLYNVSSVRAFTPASRTDGLTPRDVYLVFPGADFDMDMLSVLPMAQTSTDAPAPTVGVWHLSVRCDTCDYRLCVTARAHIHFHATVQPKDTLKIRVVGPVASVRESVLIDEYGTELAKLPFSYQPIPTDGQEVTSEGPPAELVAEVPLPSVKGSRVYAKIVGRDIRGEPFTRLSGPINQEVRMGRSASITFPDSPNDLEQSEAVNSRIYKQRIQYNDSNVLPLDRATSQVVNQRGSLLTSVQIGLSTRLYGAPGDNLQLHFEVTNYREQSVRFEFVATGELYFLRGINPASQTISSGQTANVIVSVVITATAQPGSRDLITLTANAAGGTEQVSISAYVYVINRGTTATDVWAPELRHNFQGSCIGRLGADCAQHVWSATVVARDALGGLLRISSSPIGLIYESNFISGTREEVIAIYRATCCAPRVLVTAVDAYGNANSYVVDISNYFTEAGIAAIVLGVFLLIAIIAVIVLLIYWCVRRRKESRDMPSYATSTRNIS